MVTIYDLMMFISIYQGAEQLILGFSELALKNCNSLNFVLTNVYEPCSRQRMYL